MSLYKTGELFNQQGYKLITSNSYIKSNGSLVMGAGAARDLKQFKPHIDFIFGNMISNQYGHLGKYGILGYNEVGLFQVKYHFKDSARKDLIEFSKDILLKISLKNKDKIFNLNFSGIGCGKLSESEIKPLLNNLPDNVIIWKK